MTTSEVSVSDRAGVRHVVLDRPEKKNALTTAMYDVLADAVIGAAGAEIGAVLLEARGDCFTAGNDLRDFLDRPPRGEDASVFRFLIGLATTEVPVVAAVRGAAVGIGTTMLLHCDLVYAAPSATFSVPFVDLGLVPEAGSSVLLPRRIGRARAGAALFLGQAISAEQACAAGIVTELVEDNALGAKADAAAIAIAAKPSEAVRRTKRLVNYDRDTIVAAIRREGAAFRELLGSDEARAAMAAFFARDKRG